MAYVDYEYYSSFYMGTAVPAESFNRTALQASAFIDFITFNRLKGEGVQISDEIKNATCAVMDVLKKLEDDGGIKASESIGDYSVTYDNAQYSKRNEYRLKYNAAALFLAHTGLLYRGVR